MANNLIPKELDQLIQEFLTDGILTDKERAVILKKAEGMGLDRDEIDLYLDAQVQKIDQATDAAVRKQKGKTCPYCGGSILQLTDKCPHCGENITAQASEELQEIFDSLEEALVDIKAGKDISRSKANVERYARKAKMYYEHNPKVQKLLLEIEQETADAESRAKANARKNAVLQFVICHKHFFIWPVVILIVFFCVKKCLHDSDQEDSELRQNYEQQYELDKPKIDEQFERLCNNLDELERPSESNYEEMTKEFLKIVWTDISKSTYIQGAIKAGTSISNDYEKTKKKAFLKIKRAYAEKLQEVYKQVYGYNTKHKKYGDVESDSYDNSLYYDNTPDEIENPDDIKE